MSFPLGQTITVHRMARDRYGDRTETAHFEVAGCGFAPRLSTENTGRAEEVTADAELYAPHSADLRVTDVIELADSTRWEVQGEPQRWQNPFTGWQPGVVATLRRATG